MKIRDAVPADLPAVRQLVAAFNAEHGFDVDSDVVDFFVFVAEHKAKIVGTVWVDPLSRPMRIANLFVMPSYRRHGVGRRLVRAAMVYAEQRDTEINFDVAPGAEGFYRRLGFCPLSELPPC